MPGTVEELTAGAVGKRELDGFAFSNSSRASRRSSGDMVSYSLTAASVIARISALPASHSSMTSWRSSGVPRNRSSMSSASRRISPTSNLALLRSSSVFPDLLRLFAERASAARADVSSNLSSGSAVSMEMTSRGSASPPDGWRRPPDRRAITAATSISADAMRMRTV